MMRLQTIPTDECLFKEKLGENHFHTYASLKYLSLIHISEPTRRVVISYAVFCLKKKK